MGATQTKDKSKYPPVIQTGVVCVDVPQASYNAFCSGTVSVSPEGVVTVELPVQTQKTLLAALLAPVPCEGKKKAA